MGIMDRAKRRRNKSHKKSQKPKKVLLSIVDPWDVKVASVYPVGVTSRRTVATDVITVAGSVTDDDSRTSFDRVVRAPSPWYKPNTTTSTLTSSSPRTESDNGDFCRVARSQPWQDSARTSTSVTLPARTSPDGPIKPLGTGHDGTARKLDVTDRPHSSSHEKLIDDNVIPDCFVKLAENLANVLTDDKSARVSLERIEDTNDRKIGVKSLDDLTASKKIVRENNFDDVGTSRKFEDFDHNFADSKYRSLVRSVGHNDSGNFSDDDAKTLIVKDSVILNGGRTKSDKNSLDTFDRSTSDRDRLEKVVNQLVRWRYGNRAVAPEQLNNSPVVNVAQRKGVRTDESASLNEDLVDFGVGESIVSTTTIGDNNFVASMPAKVDVMDDIRNNTQKAVTPKFSRVESDSSTTFSNSGSTPNGSTLGSETDEDANDDEMAKVPLHAPPRRKPRIVTSSGGQKFGNDLSNGPDVQSPNSTITSVNSISSLLKEKLQLSIPQALRSSKKRQNADYKLRAFVGILFLCVVFLVGFAHVYYTQHVLQRAYFEKFRFNKNERLMHVYNNLGTEVIAARLGVGIPHETGVFPCLSEDQREGAVCLEWLGQARLYLAHSIRDVMHCYHVTWRSLNKNFNPKDCFDWSSNRGHWYGAGQIQNMAYPLEQGKLDLSPFITGDISKHPFGNVLKRYFLNSKGATILVDPQTPLYVSINANRTKEFCMEARHDAFAYTNHLTSLPQLNYTICATDNMKTLHSSMAEKSLWDGLKPDELQAVLTLLSEPVWQISPTNEAAIYNYTEDVIALGFLRQGHVLLSEEWQPNPGDFVLDKTRFPTMEETINIIHRRGFKIVFTIQPFISTESLNFKDAVANRLLISERGSDLRIPALTRYRQSNSAAVLDITNNKTLPWLQTKLESLIKTYRVDSFYLDLGTGQDMPHYYKCEEPLTNPDHYKTLFTNSILGTISVIGVSSAISRPRAPVFVSLPPFPSSWKAIKTVIPTVLSYGMIGYPFIMPGAVGGDVALPMSDDNPNNDYEVRLPDKELYVRWLQLSTFLPVIRFTHLPSKYSDDSVLEMAKRLTELRQKTVTPLLKKYANETLDTGLPIIRPLWMLDPTDPACHVVVDEFSVGEELIVAPVLYSGSRQREVYLPAGVWKDGIDGSLRKGSRWIHNYRVAEDKVAYFVKMPDNTRF